MFDRMVFLGSVFNAEEMEALLTFLNDNPNIIVAFRRRKTVMLVNAEKILVRKVAAVQKLVDSLELRNYLIKLEETPTFIVYKFRPAEVKELHDLAIAVYAISNLIDTPQQNQTQPELPVESQPVEQTEKKKKVKKAETPNNNSLEKTGKPKKNEKAEKAGKVQKAESETKNKRNELTAQTTKKAQKTIRKKLKV